MKRVGSRPWFQMSLLVLSVQSAWVQAASEQLEEVIVTARKRSEPVTQVGISLNVISPDTIDALHLRTLPELVSQTQNVTLFEDFPGAGLPTWVIRGVGLQDFNSNNTPTAAVYSDGIYQVSTVMGNQALFDIDQAEVLKGPQGGLYGRNTIGGAVLLNSRRAQTGVNEQAFSLSYGRWQQAQADGMVNVPIGSTSALRLAGRVENSSDGWQRSLAGGDAHGEQQRYDLRSWLHWSSGGDWQVDWKVQGGKDDSDIGLGRSMGLYDPTGANFFCAAVMAGRRDDAHCINFGGLNLLVSGKASLIENLARQTADGSVVFSNPVNRQSNDYVGTLLELAWKGPSWLFKSLTSYDRFGYGVTLDLDGSAGEYGHRISNSDIDVVSEELQWLSLPDAPVSWLAGLVVSHEGFVEQREFNLRDNTLVKMRGLDLGQAILNYRQATTSEAAYADLSFRISDSLKLNTTVRYTHEQKKYRDGNFYMPYSPPAYFVHNLAADYDLDQHLSGSVGLEYQFSSAALGYAKVSHGFKSGGFYGGFPFSAAEIVPYQAETLVAYEAGIKQKFPQQHLQLNWSLFHYDYSDVQGFVRDINPVTGTGVDHLANLADARHDGAELEVKWQPVPQWQVDMMLGWLDAIYVNASKTTTNVAGNQVLSQGQRPYAPRWSGSVQLRYQHELGNNMQAEWALGLSAMSDFSGEQSSLIDAAVNHLPGYGKVDGSLTVTSPHSPWLLSVWSKNLLDKTYRTRVKSDGLNSYLEFFGEPRSVGLSISYRH